MTEDAPYVAPLGRIHTVVIADSYVVVKTNSNVQSYARSDIKVDQLLERLPESVEVVEDGDNV